MSADVFFNCVNLFAFAWWIVLVFVPKSRLSEIWVRSGLSAFMLAVFYWIFLGTFLFSSSHGMNLSNIAGVREFFSSDWGLLAGWVHYLCFDMLVGIQVEKRYEDRNRFLRALVLMLTFLLGPVGWSLAWLFDRQRAFGRRMCL